MLINKMHDKIVNETDIDKILDILKDICIEKIRGLKEDSYQFSVYHQKGNLYFGMSRQFAKGKSEEYYQHYIDLVFPIPYKEEMREDFWLEDSDEDFSVENFIEHIKNSEAYKTIKESNLKPLSVSSGINET